MKIGGRRSAERNVFLLDGLIILTKPNFRRSSAPGQTAEYRLKEKFQMRRVEKVVDRADSDDVKHAFELQVRDQANVLLAARSRDDKAQWMASLLLLQRRSTLERLLDTKITEENQRQPLRLPSAEQYRFAEEDSEDNIAFSEPTRGSDIAQIKGGTVVKLVERLTYHKYPEPKFLRTFLITYRTFCRPHELLDLLKERYPFLKKKKEIRKTCCTSCSKNSVKLCILSKLFDCVTSVKFP